MWFDGYSREEMRAFLTDYISNKGCGVTDIAADLNIEVRTLRNFLNDPEVSHIKTMAKIWKFLKNNDALEKQ